MTNSEKPPPRRTNVERVEHSRTAILEAALVQFADKGFGGASTRAIAREAGVSQSQLAYHFGSKTGLFNAVIDTMLAGAQEIWATLEKTDDVAAMFRSFMAGGLKQPMLVNGTLSRMLLRAAADRTPAFTEIPQRIASSMPIIPYMTEAAEAGRIRIDNPMLAGLCFAGMLHFGLAVVSNLATLPGSASLAAEEEASRREQMATFLLEQILDILLHGILPREGE